MLRNYNLQSSTGLENDNVEEASSNGQVAPENENVRNKEQSVLTVTPKPAEERLRRHYPQFITNPYPQFITEPFSSVIQGLHSEALRAYPHFVTDHIPSSLLTIPPTL